MGELLYFICVKDSILCLRMKVLVSFVQPELKDWPACLTWNADLWPRPNPLLSPAKMQLFFTCQRFPGRTELWDAKKTRKTDEKLRVKRMRLFQMSKGECADSLVYWLRCRGCAPGARRARGCDGSGYMSEIAGCFEIPVLLKWLRCMGQWLMQMDATLPFLPIFTSPPRRRLLIPPPVMKDLREAPRRWDVWQKCCLLPSPPRRPFSQLIKKKPCRQVGPK